MNLAQRICLLLAALTVSLQAGTLPRVSLVSASGRQPALAMSSDGNIGLVYGSEESIYYVTSKGGDSLFSEPVKVGKLVGLKLGMRRGPRVAMTLASMVVTAIGKEGDLFAWSSTDGGKRWGKPVVVNDQPTAAREGLQSLASGSGEDVFSVWLDLRNKGMQLFGSRSSDGGKSWGKNFEIYHSPSGSICTCCHPSVTVDALGKLHVMWRNCVDGSRDLYLSSSSDRGESFTAAKKLGKGTWPLQGCPMDGGGLASDSHGTLRTVWRRGKTLYTAFADGEEKALGQGQQPVITFGKAGEYLAWEEAGVIRVLGGKWQSAQAVGEGTFPSIGGSTRGGVVLAWESTEGIRLMILEPVEP